MSRIRVFSKALHLFSFLRFRNSLQFLRQALTVGLMLLLVSNNVLAAPGLVGLAADVSQEMRFRWYASGWAASFNRSFIGSFVGSFLTSSSTTQSGWDGKGAPKRPRPAPESPEKKEDRERKIAEVKIFPGDISLDTGQQAIFTAVAYDREGTPINGLDVKWDGLDEDKNLPVTVSQRAVFASGIPGKFKITADVAGRKAHVKVIVTGTERLPNIRSSSEKPVSSSDEPKPKTDRTSMRAPVSGRSSQVAMRRGEKSVTGRQSPRASATGLAPAAALFLPGEDDYGWNSGNYTTLDDPGTERGNMPGHALDGGAGSGNFQFAAPLLSLDGRGIDLNLGLSYNSRLWHKSGTDMYFDVDRDWVPGWILGFGKMIMAGESYILVDADGTRHPYAGKYRDNFSSPYSSLQTFEAYTNDGSFINYYAEGYKAQFDNSGGHNMVRAWAKLPNGTTVEYGAAANYAMYPKQIIDANGNFITITYRTYTRRWNNQNYTVEEGPNIDTITDTLGRQIQFHYQSQGTSPNVTETLTAVTAPDFNGTGQRVLMRLLYDTRYLSDAGSNYGFTNVTTHVRSNAIPVIKAIIYPATNTGYWFGDTDSYSNYGMLRKVSERRGMTCTVGGGACTAVASLTQQPTIGAGSMSREVVYSNHLNQPGYSSVTGSINDTPTYTRMTEDWAARDTTSAPETKFSVSDLGTTRRTIISRPDGVRVEQDTDDDPNSWYYGLLKEDRTYPNETSQDAIHKSKVFWERTGSPGGDPDNYDLSYRSPRPTRTEVVDDRGLTTATDYGYGSYYNQVINKTEYGYGGTAQLHRTYSEYENGASYRGDWAYRGTLWFDGSTSPTWSGPHIFNLVKLTDVYAADNTTRVARAVYEYDQQTASQLQTTPGVAQHLSAPDQRGNVTSVKRYAKADTPDEGTAVVETRNYDVCGNIVKLTTSCCEQTTFQYGTNTQYAWPESTTRGSATDATKQNTTTAVYDLHTGLVKETYDANGRRSNIVYQALTLRPEFEYAPTDAYAYHIYDDANLVVYDLVYKAGASGADVASRSDKYLDGQGRVHGEIAYGKDYVMDFVLTKFDNLGRLWEQSRPYRSGTPPMYAYEYDTLDRTTKVTAPDGSIVERFYNESSYPSAATPSAMGQTVRAKDAWGRERWARFDEQNRLVEVVEPDPNGNGAVATGGMKTSYGYDTLGNLTLVTQGDQTRSFQYDALSRLTAQKLAERDATLNDAGVFIATWDDTQKKVTATNGAQWSDVFNYDNRSNLVWRVEARGVKTLFNYNNDPLNRLQSVQYDTTGVPSGLIGSIPAAPDVTYAYLTTGDKSRLHTVTMSDGMGNETFSYDSEGRLSQASQTFPGRTSYPLVTDYLWDSLDRSQELNYPAQWGVSGNPRKKVEPLYDMASRVDTLKYDAANYASGFVYNAASQVESLNVGSQITESYTFDGSTGLLFEQEVKKGATTHLKLKYNYTLTNSGTNSGAKTGQLTGITDVQTASRSKAYVYDKLGRLKEAKGGSDAFSNPSWTQTYTYDRYGNRTGVSKSGSGAGSVPLDGLASLVYTNAQSQTVNNRITTSGYEYDPAGNQTRGQVEGGTWRRYKYDAAGRLAVVMDDSSNPLESYSYGASNERLVTVFGTGSGDPAKYYCWEGGQVIAEYHAGTSSNLVWDKNYVHLGGRLLATTDSGGTKYHHPDRLGTRLVTDTSGNVATEQANLPFGTALGAESTGTPTNRRFTSYDRSATTGMDYAVNRFYNPAQGRFNQVDPIGMSAASLDDPQTLNLYNYCGNDPVNHVDPDGLFWGKLFGWVGKALKWIAVAAVVAVAILTFVAPGGWVAGLAIWSGKHAILSAILGINTPHFAIVNLIAISTSSGAAALGIGAYVLSSVGAISSLLAQKIPGQKGGKKPGKEPKPKATPDPCGDDKRNFYKQTDLFKSMASQMNTDYRFIMAHAAHESGWLNQHNRNLNNLFGLTRGGGRNIKYSSLQEGANYYVKTYSKFLNGSKTMDEYVQNLRKIPYNSVTSDYDQRVKDQYQSIFKWAKICGATLQ